MGLQATICSIYRGLTLAGDWLAMVPLRLLIGWEFYEAGISKLNGSNWFDNIVDDFPFPFNVIPVGISWFLATWTEIIGAISVVAGVATRFWIVGLIILDIVAWVSVHADNGYNVCDNGYKLPLMYLVIMIPLLLYGAGKLSIDHAISKIRR